MWSWVVFVKTIWEPTRHSLGSVYIIVLFDGKRCLYWMILLVAIEVIQDHLCIQQLKDAFMALGKRETYSTGMLTSFNSHFPETSSHFLPWVHLKKWILGSLSGLMTPVPSPRPREEFDRWVHVTILVCLGTFKMLVTNLGWANYTINLNIKLLVRLYIGT